MPLGPSNTKITLKSPVTGLLFLFHLGNCLTTIGVAQISFPISIEFDACVVIPWGDLENQGYIQTRAKTIYICMQTLSLVTKMVVMKVVTVHVMHGT
jgi:hypothetical protein